MKKGLLFTSAGEPHFWTINSMKTKKLKVVGNYTQETEISE